MEQAEIETVNKIAMSARRKSLLIFEIMIEPLLSDTPMVVGLISCLQRTMAHNTIRQMAYDECNYDDVIYAALRKVSCA